MGVAAQEVRRNRLLVSLLAVCLVLAAILQLNGRSILAVGESKAGAFATLVQADPKGVAGGLAPATGPVGRLLDSASRSFGNRRPRAVAGPPAATEPGTAGSSGANPQLASADTPSTVPAASAASGESSARGPAGIPPFSGLLSQFSPISGPGGFSPDRPTPQPTPPTGSPTPDPTTTPSGPTPTPTPTPTPPVTEPTPTPTPTTPVVDPTPTPTPPVVDPTPLPTSTPPVIDPTGPISPVPEPAAWALWLLGFGVTGGLIRWRRRALNAVAAKDAGGDAA